MHQYTTSKPTNIYYGQKTKGRTTDVQIARTLTDFMRLRRFFHRTLRDSHKLYRVQRLFWDFSDIFWAEGCDCVSNSVSRCVFCSVKVVKSIKKFSEIIKVYENFAKSDENLCRLLNAVHIRTISKSVVHPLSQKPVYKSKIEYELRCKNFDQFHCVRAKSHSYTDIPFHKIPILCFILFVSSAPLPMQFGVCVNINLWFQYRNQSNVLSIDETSIYIYLKIIRSSTYALYRSEIICV